MESSQSGKNMQGKTCLVTGATSGIGRAAAASLAALGAEVVIAGRDPRKTRDAAGQIISETGNGSVHYLLADFSDLQQVRGLAAEFRERYSRLDVLINNAGAYNNSRIKTPYGIEKTFLVNYLASFLLTDQLLSLLKSSAPARIINVSSDSHIFDSLNFDDLGFEHGYFGLRAYGRSKLANILFTYELARRLAGTGVAVNAVHPGRAATDIWRTNFPVIGPALKYVMRLFALTPAQGADTLVYLASSPDAAGITGQYFFKRKPILSSPQSRDEKIARLLWEISEKLILQKSDLKSK